MSHTVIVVGLSAASIAFVTKLRSQDKQCQIICFSAEAQLPYNRCLLADFLTGESTQEQITLKSPDFFEQNNIICHFNAVVEKIDTQGQQVLVGAVWHRYDYLFLGIGTRPFIPHSLQNSTAQGVFTFHTLSDMQKIEQFLAAQKPKTAVVIGAGLNGMEAASALASKGVSVTIVEAQPLILPGQVDREVGAWVATCVQMSGTMMVVGRKVTELLARHGSVSGVVLDSGTKINADMVVIAAGSKLNSELVESAGILTDKGCAVVSQNMQTSVPKILAAGDICAVPDAVTKQLVRSTTWSDAMLQGLCAATTLSVTPRAYQGAIGLRDSYFFGKDFYACGDTTGKHFMKKTIVADDQNLQVWYLYEEKLMGFVLLGDISAVSELKQWYMTRKVLA